MDYSEAWTFLDNLQFFKIKLGLDSMSRFLEKVGNPHKEMRFIHVAGTNGKGSVSMTLLTLLAKAGYKVGLYTSPHLSSVRERFRINNSFISEEDFSEQATKIREVLGDNQITYFEFTTALAMLWFAKEKVDLAILEVGMGGRLDATNVVTPLASVITNVSMDHEAYLGDTLEAVAGEKAGVIKPGVPVISGVGADVSREVVERTCRERGASLALLGRDFRVEGTGADWQYKGLRHDIASLSCALKGNYQPGNAALALAVLETIGKDYPVAESVIRDGLQGVRWPGRMEYFCISNGKTTSCSNKMENVDQGMRRYLLDGAHNPAGVQSLTESLRTEIPFKRLILVWGSMADKDMANTLNTMAPLAGEIIFTRPEGERSATAEQLLELLAPEEKDKALLSATVQEALDTAAQKSDPEDLICVAGSLYLVGASRQLLLGELVEQ